MGPLAARALALSLLAWGVSGAAPAGTTPPGERPDPPAESAPASSSEVLGAAAAFGEESPPPRLSLPAGTALRERPDPRSPALETLDAPAELPVLERRGPWARVAREALRGWVLVPGARDGEDAGDGPVPALAGGGPDPELLEHALARLSGEGGGEEGGARGAAGPARSRSPRSLGPYTLYTDVEDEDLLGFLGRLAGDLHRVYQERYGLDPAPQPGDGPPDAVVLFARPENYRAFAEADAALAGLEAGGFAGFGLAALAAGGRSRMETAALLVHELAHLANARTLGPRTPPWLEEGLANDLSFSRIDPSGRLDPARLGGTSSVRARWPGAAGGTVGERGGVEVTVTSAGGRAALERLSEALDRGELVPLEELVRLSWHRLVEPDQRRLVYAQSAFFVRYLLDGAPSGRAPERPPETSPGDPEGEPATAFRAYLRDLAAGRAADPEALPEALGTDWATLDRDLRRWLRQRSRRSSGAGVGRQ